MNAIRRHSLVFTFALLVLFTLPSGQQALGQQAVTPDSAVEVMAWRGHEVVRDEILVQFKPDLMPGQRAALHQGLDCSVVQTVAPGLERIRLNGRSLDEALQRYNRDPLVEYAEPHAVYRYSFTPNDPKWGQQWGPKNMKCPEAWDIYKGDPATIVAILDSSLDTGHEDLAANLVYGYDYVNGDSDPYDFLDFIGHGTHTSGIAAAVTNNGKGIAGVGFNCKFAFYQVGTVLFITDSAVIQSINDTITKGWHVISMSFGGTASSQSMQNALNSAYNAGVICVAAAGNDGTTVLQYPAAYSSVLSVASHNSSNQKSSFSTYGAWVDVSAPGEGIHSTIYEFWGGYTNMDGTSMACPGVAGMANILYSLIGGVRNKANADTVIAAIKDSSVPVTYVDRGRVDMEAAMQLLSITDPPVIASVSPASVQAFHGTTITVTGQHFTGATEVNSGGAVLTPPDFTIVDDSTLTYAPPVASALGAVQVTVTSSAGTSNPGTFSYVETDPPKLAGSTITGVGSTFIWNFGAGAGDLYGLLVAPDTTTFNYQGFDILVNFFIVTTGGLDSVGLGSFQAVIPPLAVGTIFNTQILTGDPDFVGASNILSTMIIN